MKKLSVFACISFFALASFTLKPEINAPAKADVVAPEAVAGSITILTVDPDGYSGVAVTSSGVAVSFINPLHLPISVGAVASASITIDCPIIDPPVNPAAKKKKNLILDANGVSIVPEDTSGSSTTNTYGVAVILSL